jgi:hypothetical protein
VTGAFWEDISRSLCPVDKVPSLGCKVRYYFVFTIHDAMSVDADDRRSFLISVPGLD